MKKLNYRPFDLHYDKEKGHFLITMFDKGMIGNRLTARIGKMEASLVNMSRKQSIDEWGLHEEWILNYQSPTKEERIFTGVMKIYQTFTIFETTNHFEIKGKKNKSLYGQPYLSFPCFEGEDWDKECSCLSFKRQAPFNYPEQWQGRVTESLREGKNTPLMVTNRYYETIVLSPLSHLLHGTVSISRFQKSIRCGIPRGLLKIPQDTRSETLMVYGRGVNATLERWGTILQVYHNVEPIGKEEDVLLKYMSYWTNAGSAYWYNTYKKSSYEDTITKLKDQHDKQGISFGSYELDSWWYKKEGDEYTSGIIEWEPKVSTRSKNFNSMVPFFEKYKDLDLFKFNRLSYVQALIGKPLGCHFKQLANESIYVKAAPDNFIIEDFPMPKNYSIAKELFKKIFDHPKWHLSYIVHDWLQYMNDKHSGFRDINVGNDYFKALNDACMEIPAPENESQHLSIQLCMTQPHMTLHSVTMPSVTTIRSTSDANSFFVEGRKRWRWHLYSSKFIQVLGKYAFFDNRMTKKGHWHPYSSYSQFEMIWLALSCGPIGIGDRIGKENIDLIRKTVKDNGEILKPDIPSSPFDKCYLYNPHTLKSKLGIGVFSFSSIDMKSAKNYKVYYVLVFNAHPIGRKVHFQLALNELDTRKERQYAVYDYLTGEINSILTYQITNYVMQGRKYYYQIIAPIEYGIAIIGDISKHISASQQVVSNIEIKINYIRIEFCNEYKNKEVEFVLYSKRKPEEVLYNGQEQDFVWKNNKLTISFSCESNSVGLTEEKSVKANYLEIIGS